VRAAFRHFTALPGLPASEHTMMDVLMMALGIVFFALTIAYVYACDAL